MKLSTFYSKNDAWSNTTQVFFDVHCFSHEISLVHQLYSHSLQTDTVGDHPLPDSDFQEGLDLITTSGESHSSNIDQVFEKIRYWYQDPELTVRQKCVGRKRRMRPIKDERRDRGIQSTRYHTESRPENDCNESEHDWWCGRTSTEQQPTDWDWMHT